MGTIDSFSLEYVLWPFGALLLLSFCAWYLAPSFSRARALKKFSKQLQILKVPGSNPIEASSQNVDLLRLWTEYRKTLHTEKSVDESGLEVPGRYRATAPAAAFFNSGSVFDGRISVEFFRHLPGLLTGLGIIGTFNGLISGLGGAYGDGGLNAPILIAAVRHAFIFSASAIAAAMVVTFLEKWRYARLQHLTDKICNEIDQLYHSGVGEEYLERLVKASEQALTNSQQIKDSVIGELREMLQRLSDRQVEAVHKQIEASNSQNAELRASLLQPMEAVAQGIGEFGRSQNQAIGTGFQDQMATFADRLDQLLGGQVAQARELQGETVRALEMAVAQFEVLAQKLGSAGENATTAMTTQLHQALDGMAERQSQIADTMRNVLNDMREGAGKAQTDVQHHLTDLLQGLGGQMSAIMSSVQEEADASGEAARAHQQQFSEETQRTVQGLTGEVRNQTQAIEAAAAAMRGAVADLANSANRSITATGESAAKMSSAANEFTRTGTGLAEMFQRANMVTANMTQIAEALRNSSADVGRIVGDYAEARSDFEAIVAVLRETVETAKRDASMTSEVVKGIEQAAERLRQCQGEADAYLAKLNGVFAEAFDKFSGHMRNTVEKTNKDFHQHLTTSTSLLSGAIEQLGDELDRWPTRPQ